MKVKRYDNPGSMGAVNAEGTLSPVLIAYLAGIQDVSGRVAAYSGPLAPGATSAEIIATINQLIAALKAARLMQPEA